MSDFIQIHAIVSYPPSNLNRDDLGRPKNAIMGGVQRLRISSQSLKRAWRESPFFKEALAGHLGIRTKRMGVEVYNALRTGANLTDLLNGSEVLATTNPTLTDEQARDFATQIAAAFGKSKSERQADAGPETGDGEDDGDPDAAEPKKKAKPAKKAKKAGKEKKARPLEVEQLVHFSPEEITAIGELVAALASGGKTELTSDDLTLLRQNHHAVDIAMFGRMIASAPRFSVEAAVQVAHAITVHEVAIEDDFFTAVDDLNRGEEDVGAAHMDETEFAAGIFYLYVCVDRTTLVQNLDGDEELARAALRALAESISKIGPSGKQATFASRAYASYMLAERGSQQPRSLAVAFLKPVKSGNMLETSTQALETARANIDAVYGQCWNREAKCNAGSGEGTLEGILDFVGA